MVHSEKVVVQMTLYTLAVSVARLCTDYFADIAVSSTTFFPRAPLTHTEFLFLLIFVFVFCVFFVFFKTKTTPNCPA